MTWRRQSGFTLVELIIALTLTALILAALGSALHGLGQGFARGTQQADRVDRMVRVSQALRNSLLRIPTTPLGTPDHPPLVGDAAGLTWQASLPESTPVQGVFQWQLQVRDQALDILLQGDPQADAPVPPSRLVDDLRSLALAYQDPATGQWLDRWDALTLPLRVRLEIDTQSDGRWPPIVVLLGQPA